MRLQNRSVYINEWIFTEENLYRLYAHNICSDLIEEYSTNYNVNINKPIFIQREQYINSYPYN